MTVNLRCISLIAIAGAIACSSVMTEPAVAELEGQAPRDPTARRITILHVNDTHSHLEAEGPKDREFEGTLGGIVKAASVIRAFKASDPSVLFVHVGDVFQEDVYFGTSQGVAELGLLSNGLGLDVMTLGNHEFNFTPAVLVQALSAAFSEGGSPLVTTNLDYRNASLAGLAAFVRPNVVKEVGGVRIGFFGLVTPDLAEQFPGPATDPPAIDANFIAIANAQVQLLRQAPNSVDVVVLLAHVGVDVQEQIARAVPGLDAIVGGHDHVVRGQMVTAPDGKQVLVANAGEFYKWVGKLTLIVRDHQVVGADEEFIAVDATTERFQPFADVVEVLQAQANAIYGEELFHTPIAFTPTDVAKDPIPGRPQRDSPVGGLIADALRNQGGTDIALTANGFLTEGLTRGFIVREDAFRIVGDSFDPADPFGRRLGSPLYRIQLTGDVLQQAIQAALGIGGDFFPQVSGMSIAFDPNDPRSLDVRIGGEGLDPARSYSATVHFGLLQGLEQLLGASVDSEPLGVTDYEAVRDWLAHQWWVRHVDHSRVVDLSLCDSSDPMECWPVEGQQPSPNESSRAVREKCRRLGPGADAGGDLDGHVSSTFGVRQSLDPDCDSMEAP